MNVFRLAPVLDQVFKGRYCEQEVAVKQLFSVMMDKTKKEVSSPCCHTQHARTYTNTQYRHTHRISAHMRICVIIALKLGCCFLTCRSSTTKPACCLDCGTPIASPSSGCSGASGPVPSGCLGWRLGMFFSLHTSTYARIYSLTCSSIHSNSLIVLAVARGTFTW